MWIASPSAASARGFSRPSGSVYDQGRRPATTSQTVATPTTSGATPTPTTSVRPSVTTRSNQARESPRNWASSHGRPTLLAEPGSGGTPCARKRVRIDTQRAESSERAGSRSSICFWSAIERKTSPFSQITPCPSQAMSVVDSPLPAEVYR